MRSALAACDAAFLGWKRLGIYRYGVSPNKLWDYMAAGCPIVHATSAPGDPVAACGCGMSVPAEDPRGARGRHSSTSPPVPPRSSPRWAGGVVRASRQNNDYAVLAARFLAAVEQSGR